MLLKRSLKVVIACGLHVDRILGTSMLITTVSWLKIPRL